MTTFSLEMGWPNKKGTIVYHTILNRRLTLDMLSLTLMIGSFFLKSHTTQREPNVEAKMCWTCLFHDTQETSSGGWKKTQYLLIARGFNCQEIA